MNTESYYAAFVVYGMLVIGVLGGIYFLVAAHMKTRKLEIEEKKKRELDNLWVEKKMMARNTVSEFRKKAHLINPITFSNGITVSFVKNHTHVSIYKELIRFGIEYKIEGKLYYDVISYDSDLSYIIREDKYSLEELKGYDWIIETAYNFTEDRINKIKEEKIKEELFVKSVKNNDVVAKINQ